VLEQMPVILYDINAGVIHSEAVADTAFTASITSARPHEPFGRSSHLAVAHERACSTIPKVVAFAFRSFISPSTVFSSLRPTQ